MSNELTHGASQENFHLAQTLRCFLYLPLIVMSSPLENTHSRLTCIQLQLELYESRGMHEIYMELPIFYISAMNSMKQK